MAEPMNLAGARGAPAAHRWLERGSLLHGVIATGLLALIVLAVRGPIPRGDIALYHRYALAFWTGPEPLRHFPAEYPPLSIVPFSLSLVPPLDFVPVWALWMAVAFLAGFIAVDRMAGRAAALTYAAYLLVGAAGTLLSRYDLVPALVTIAALHATRARRFDLAVLLLGAGTLLKLYPLFLLPLVLIEQRRVLVGAGLERGLVPEPVLRSAAIFALAVGGGFAITALADPAGWTSPFIYALQRPLQVESVPATLLWLGSPFGYAVHPVLSFHSYNIVGPIDWLLKDVAGLGLAAGCLYVYWRHFQGRLPLGRAFLACLCVVVLTGKVFSPQYMIWLLPLVALEEGFDPLWVAICVFTTLIFPIGYRATMPRFPADSYSWVLLTLVAVRNALLILAAGRLLFRRGEPSLIELDSADRAQKAA